MFELLRTFANGHELTPFARFSDVARPFGAFAAIAGNNAVPADVVETADALEVVLDLPGYARDSVAVSFENDLLTIEAERKAESLNGATHLVSERGIGDRSR
jgi:HSP20 family molecular chaperone IbpA